MLLENMPVYRANHVRSELTTETRTISANLALGDPVDQFIAPLLTSVMINGSGGHKFCIQTVLILTGFLTEAEQPKLRRMSPYNHNIAVYASEIISYSFSVYGFNSGHFISTHASAPFQVAIASNTHQCGQALFKHITCCPVILDSADDLLRLIDASSSKSTIHGYCIHYHIFLKRDTEQKFWTVQAAIVGALRAKRGLIAVLVFVHPSFDMTLACGLRQKIQRTGWIISTNDVYYPDLGYTVADSGTLLIGIHKPGSCQN